ncbi:MAG: hypothetical protein K8W52_06235 [Deltaproteobacteria bacterium]|nr:hypothetical protein [Deltaproteobacteria bacterium]
MSPRTHRLMRHGDGRSRAGWVVAAAALCVLAGTARADEPAPEPAPAPAPPPTAAESPAPPAQPAASPPSAPDAPAPAPLDIKAIRDACEAEKPGCDPVMLLGGLERRTLARALAERNLALDPAPWGKRLRNIHVDNFAVFAPGDRPLDLLNAFHRTTREAAIEREVLLRPGQPWRQRLVDETARKLRDPIYTSVAVVVPILTDEPGTVDLLVVTRDVWSLRLNSYWEVQAQTFTYLTFALSENNFLGWRKVAAMVFAMDLGQFVIGPEYIDKNMFGRKLTLKTKAALVFGRKSGQVEGSVSSFDLSRPLWSLDSHWGAGIAWKQRYDIARSYRGLGIRTYDAPETPGDDMIPREYRERTFSLTTSGVRQWGGVIEQQLRFGHILALQRPVVLSDFPGDPVERAAFERDVLPRSERSSQVFVGYAAFTPRYHAFHDVDTFELAEDTQLGPNLSMTAGLARGEIGSERDFVALAANASYTVAFGDDGVAKISGTTDHRLEGGKAIDNYATADARLVTPNLFCIGRVVAEVEVATRWAESQNRFLSAGGDSGLRGFIVGEFIGQRRLVGHLEVRTAPRHVWFTRVGGVAFYDVGGAADTLRDMPIHQDVGVGLRILVPQTSPEPLRFDWAIGLDGANRGFPGRFIAGYRQGF